MATTRAKAKPDARAARPRLAVPASCMGLMNRQQVGDALGGMHPKTVGRMVHAGEFPPPDRVVRGRSLWKVATVNAYVAGL